MVGNEIGRFRSPPLDGLEGGRVLEDQGVLRFEKELLFSTTKGIGRQLLGTRRQLLARPLRRKGFVSEEHFAESSEGFEEN